MDDLIRIENEYDRQTVLWLHERLGEQALNEVVLRMESRGRPYASEVCRTLGLTPPPPRKRATPRAQPLNRAVGEAYLATIRGILGSRHVTA